MGDKPVNFVSWYDSIRFANWLNNGQGTGSTETGAYTLGLGRTATPTNGHSITRNAGRDVVPDQRERVVQGGLLSARRARGRCGQLLALCHAEQFDADARHSQHRGQHQQSGDERRQLQSTAPDWNSLDGNVTTVGSAGPLSQSFYGTSDQAGNVSEWNDTSVTFFGQSHRGAGGGSFDSFTEDVWSNRSMGAGIPVGDGADLGFRVATVATVPEPSTGVLAVLAFGLMWVLRKRTK